MQEATAGNPFFALELGRELVRTDTRPTPGQRSARSRELAGAARRPPRPAAGRDRRRPRSWSRRSPGRRSSSSRRLTDDDEARVLEALEAAVREGVVELDDTRVRFAHPLLASICYDAGAGLETPRRAPGPRRAWSPTSRSGPATWLSPPTARTRPSPPSSTRPPSRRPAAARRPRRAELWELAAELTPGDPALARKRRVRAAKFYRLAGDRERSATTLLDAAARSEVPSGVERADVLFALCLHLERRHSDAAGAVRRGTRPRQPTTTFARRGSSPFRSWFNLSRRM